MGPTRSLVVTLFGDLGAESRTAHQNVQWQIVDLKREFAEVKRELAEVKQQIADLKAQITGIQGELIKWTFAFWLGTIGIVLLLIRFPG